MVRALATVTDSATPVSYRRHSSMHAMEDAMEDFLKAAVIDQLSAK